MSRARRRAALLIAAGAAAGALAAPVLGGAAAAPAAPSAGCGLSHAGGITEETIDFEGTPRAYRLAVPENYTGKKPLGLILNFHGFGSNAIQQAIYSQLEEKGPERGYVVITPDGTPPRMFWNILPNLATPDDIAYTERLIEATETRLCVNTARIYATGISNGAGMSAYLGCQVGDRLAAIAPVAGVNLLQGDCPEARGVSMIAFHGEADATVSYTGTPPGGSSPNGSPLPPVEDAVATWAISANDCKKRPSTEAVSEHVRLTDYSGCKRRSDVQLYAVSDGGHTWPGSLDVPRLGHVTSEINAADLMLDFFDEHRRR